MTIYDYVLQMKFNSHWITLKAMDQEIYQTLNWGGPEELFDEKFFFPGTASEK